MHTSPTVAIIEDEYYIRETFKQALEWEGYNVLCYANGLDALTHLEKGPKPDLILLDLMMPVMNGQEFLDVRKKKLPSLADVPIVVVSAIADRILKNADVKAYVTKPIELDRLFAVVAEYCDPVPQAA